MKKSTRLVSIKKPIGTHDLFNLKLPTSVSISNNESKIAYTVEWMDEKENKYYQNLHLVDVHSKKSVQFTHGNQSDSSAIW